MLSSRSLDELLRFPHRGLKKPVDSLSKVHSDILRLFGPETQVIDSTALVYLLPFTCDVNTQICRLFKEGEAEIKWKHCLAAVALLMNGTVDCKLKLIIEVFSLSQTPCSGINTKLKSILKRALHDAQSLWFLLGSSAPSKDTNSNLVLSHSDQNIDFMADRILSSYKKNQALDLYKPVSFAWKCRTVQPYDKKSSPSSRSMSAVCVSGHCIYLIGGKDNRYPLTDIWAYDVVTESWTCKKPEGVAIPYLMQHTAISHEERIYIFGGVDRLVDDSDAPLWIYNIVTNQMKKWEPVGDVTLPPCLKAHSAVVYNDNMYIYGGFVELSGSSDILWSFDLKEEMWNLVFTKQSKRSSPQPRHSHSATIHQDNMYIIGGVNELTPYSDMWLWSFRSMQWSKIKPSNSLPPVYGHCTVEVGNSLFVIGGKQLNHLNKTVWEFKIDSKSWKARDNHLIGGPEPRSYLSAILISPDSLSVPVTQRAISEPAFSNKPDILLDIHRPRTSPETTSTRESSKPQENFSPIKTLIPKSQTFTVAQDEPPTDICCAKRTLSLYNTALHDDAPDLYISHTLSDSEELLLKRSSGISEQAFTFDNPAYISSQEELLTTRSSSTNITVYSELYAPDLRQRTYTSRISRSMDTLKDICCDDAPALPGAVITPCSDLLLSDKCPIRNIVINDSNDKSSAVPKLSRECQEQINHTEEQSDDENNGMKCTDYSHFLADLDSVGYQLFVMGGETRNKLSFESKPLEMWVCELTNKCKTKKL